MNVDEFAVKETGHRVSINYIREIKDSHSMLKQSFYV